ncbi:MAG: isochorismatase family protein, partial [Firmicutes bacterium]|nr:isochorismatase family protein [Bacillota bacterium]
MVGELQGPAVAPDAALIVVDVQNDFCPGGALPVPDGDRVIPVLNAAVRAFVAAGRPVAFTRDWHPAGHVSFLDRGGPWPPHCVQGTPGAAYHPRLERPAEAAEFLKGEQPDRDAYSGFEGHRFDAGAGTLTGEDLAGWLRARGTGTVYIGG